MKEEKRKTVRKNIYMGAKVADWYEAEAESLAVSQSALMTMVLNNYIDQKNSMDLGETLKSLLEIVEERPEK